MKTKLLFLLLLFITVSVQAQITVTNSVFPADGDVIHIRTSTNVSGINIGTASNTSQTWDFSSVTAGNEQSLSVTAANNATFPNADIKEFDFRLNGDGYFKNSGNDFELVGFSGDFLGIGVAVDVPFNDGSILLSTPLTMGTTYTDESDFQVTLQVTPGSPLDSLIQSLSIPASVVINAVRVTFNDTLTHTVDAFGQLTIDGFAAPFDVLREKNFRISNTLVEMDGTLFGIPTGWIDPSTIAGFPPVPFGGRDTSEYYVYYNDASKEPIARVNMDSTRTAPASIEVKSNATSVYGINKATSTVRAFPNPVMDYLNLEYKGFTPGKYQVKIFNIIGREVWGNSYDIRSRSGKLQIDVTDLRKGTYLYSIIDRNGKTISTKRVMVIKP